ncbi:unnamed protein product [Protopolystoma xenopodis]|uniref:Nuclear transcription factor Y subunit gamma n=1 Tax=Protopolystoma xenopodis TaxID=117903 RepID=A0A448XRZ0_9PLAT|nr:unnamed protein product [Protopolystoma xenopodis]
MDYVNEPSESHAQTASFWELAKLEIDEMKQDHNAFKTQDLPLARIKKIMKLDDDVKAMMISAEAPILFAKAAELFIRELTLRAWLHTERNRRRTLQRNDVAMAVSDSDTDQFDFLIDIVPREEARGHRRSTSTQQSVTTVSPNNSAAAATATIINNVPSLNTGQKLDYKTVTIPATNGVSATADGIVVSPTPSATAAAMQQSAAAVIGQANNPLHSAAGTIATGPIQYVLQLPASAAAAAPGQSFQLQVLPQQFQV